MTADPFHDRLLKIVLSLPGAYEDRPWGSVHCKVAEKIFVGWGRHDDGEMEIGFRVSMEMQSMLVASDPRFKIAKYVGKYGGVDMRIGAKPNWNEVEQFIVESYRMIAPKKLVKELDARSGAGSATTPAKTETKTATKTAAKPTAKGKAAEPAAKKTAAPKKKTAATPDRLGATPVRRKARA